jgi:hypothetical protein
MKAYTRVFIYISFKLSKFQYVMGGAVYVTNRRQTTRKFGRRFEIRSNADL